VNFATDKPDRKRSNANTGKVDNCTSLKTPPQKSVLNVVNATFMPTVLDAIDRLLETEHPIKRTIAVEVIDFPTIAQAS
jgi:hypothetical protein